MNHSVVYMSHGISCEDSLWKPQEKEIQKKNLKGTTPHSSKYVIRDLTEEQTIEIVTLTDV